MVCFRCLLLFAVLLLPHACYVSWCSFCVSNYVCKHTPPPGKYKFSTGEPCAFVHDACAYTCACACASACTCACLCACVCVCVCVCGCVWSCACVCACRCACVCVWACVFLQADAQSRRHHDALRITRRSPVARCPGYLTSMALQGRQCWDRRRGIHEKPVENLVASRPLPMCILRLQSVC